MAFVTEDTPVNENIGGLKDGIRKEAELEARTGLLVVYGGFLTKIEFTLGVC